MTPLDLEAIRLVRHGYYLAAAMDRRGDPEFSAQAKRAWFSLGVNDPRRYDGCSVFTRPDGSVCVRATVEDFFAEKFRVAVLDFDASRKAGGR